MALEKTMPEAPDPILPLGDGGSPGPVRGSAQIRQIGKVFRRSSHSADPRLNPMQANATSPAFRRSKAMTFPYSFKDALQHAERINWRVDELIGPDKPLDFSKPFMPESLARTEAMSFLNGEER